jgi:hypothetical protein
MLRLRLRVLENIVLKNKGGEKFGMWNLWSPYSSISTATRPQTGRRVNQHRYLEGAEVFSFSTAERLLGYFL